MSEQQQTTRWNFPFMKGKKFFIFVSILAVILSIFSVYQFGFNYGVDFQGGVKLVYQFNDKITEREIRSVLDGLEIGDIQIVQYGEETENSILIKAKSDEANNVVELIANALRANISNNSFTVLSEEVVGPKVGEELRGKALKALIGAWICILIYVGIRFDFLFSPGALIALIHDIIITAGIFAFFGKEVNLPILAAALTIIGYSINDTIVVYDRVRENIKKLSVNMPLDDLLDISLNETLSRTLVTSFTLLVAVVVLFVFGGAVLHDFALCMLIGVTVGTYSSIFIASPIYLFLQKKFPHKGMERGEPKKK